MPDPLGLGKKLLDAKNPLSSMGKGLIGGVDKKLQSVARDFAETATTDVRAALMERLASDEGQDLMRQIRAHASKHLLAVPLATVLREVDGLPRADIEALVSGHPMGEALAAMSYALARGIDEGPEMMRAASGPRGGIKELLEKALKVLNRYDFKPHIMRHSGNDVGR